MWRALLKTLGWTGLRLAALAGLIIGLGGAQLPAAAQAPGARVLVHTVTAGPSTFLNTAVPGLKLTTTFTLLEADGTVIRTKIKDGEARLLLADLQYRGDFGVLPPDWSVVVLVDASLTLGNGRAFNDFRSARDSLSRSFQSVPENTNLALVTFGDRTPTLQELIKDRDGLSKKIAALTASPSGRACLNDGLYEAVNKLTGLQGRKAVFAFTASADNCSTRPLSQVVDLARQNGVQMYAVGLDGYTVAQADLDAFTQPTGGLGVMTGLSRLGPTLDNLVALLSNQWQVVWTLCPPQGAQTGALNLLLDDARVVSATVPFTSDQNYACPPRVAVVGMEAATRSAVRFNLSVTNRAAINRLEAQITNKATGLPVVTQSVTEITSTVSVPAADLKKGVDYLATVTALNANNQVLAATTEPFAFRYDPAAPELKITAVDGPTLERSDFVVTATVQNPAGYDLRYYKAWLVGEQNNTLVPGTQITRTLDQALVIPGAQVDSGSYLVMAQALDGDQQSQADAPPFKITYQRPTNLDRLIYQLRQYQWAGLLLGGLSLAALVGLLAVAWFMFIAPGRRARVKTVELALPEQAHRSAAPVTAPPPARRAEPTPAPPATPPPPARSAPPEARRPEPPLPQPSPKPTPAPQAQVPTPEKTVLAITPATLTVVEPATVRLTAIVAKTPFTVGRRAGNDAVIPVEGTSGVSGEHCVLTFAGGFWYLQDDKSTYGTTLNGQPAPKGQPVRLEDGALLGLGPIVKMKFQLTRR